MPLPLSRGSLPGFVARLHGLSVGATGASAEFSMLPGPRQLARPVLALGRPHVPIFTDRRPITSYQDTEPLEFTKDDVPQILPLQGHAQRGFQPVLYGSAIKPLALVQDSPEGLILRQDF